MSDERANACVIRALENGLLVTFPGEMGRYCADLGEVLIYMKMNFPDYWTPDVEQRLLSYLRPSDVQETEIVVDNTPKPTNEQNTDGTGA